ncbi:MAG: peroxiredoxin [Acidimicrobiales bacterium]|jgi:peroxiredoxin
MCCKPGGLADRLATGPSYDDDELQLIGKGRPLTIAVGDLIPDVEVQTMTDGGPKRVRTGEVLGSGKVVLFAVPGAFTPTCSDFHLPGFVRRAEDLKAKGVDTIACISVNDPFVMGAWGRDQSVGSNVLMLADGNGAFTEAVGLEMDGSPFGLGRRSQRYALIADNGVVSNVFVEPKGGLDVSSADSVLAAL